MTGLGNPHTVDLVAQEADGSVSLIIVHTEQWTGTPPEAEALTRKVNTYVSFALDGGLRQHYPDLDATTMRVQIDHMDSLPPAVERHVDRLRTAVRRYGLDLTTNQLPREPEPPPSGARATG